MKTKSSKGKSKKQTWKRIAHPDVDTFLADQRRDERLGLDKLSNRSNDTLFYIDTGLELDDDYTELSRKKKEEQERKKTAKMRKKTGPLVDLDELTCFKVFKPDSKVEDPVVKRNPKGPPKKSLDMKLKDELRNYRKVRPTRSNKIEILTDLWSDDGSNHILQNEWISEDAKRNNLPARLRTNRKVERKVNLVKAVELPDPGFSYNPSFEDHQRLLSASIESEKLKLKKQAKILRSTAVAKFDGDGTLPEIKDEEVKTEIETIKIPKSSKPKTKQQRRKEREQKEIEMGAKEKKKKATAESQVFRIKTLKKQIEANSKKSKLRLEKKAEKREEYSKFGTKTLSKHKFEEKIDLPVLSEELPKGLISAGGQSTGELLVDRFKSLQKRNVIETTVKIRQKRKNKPKLYIRDSDKMEWEKTGVYNGEKILVDNSGAKRTRLHLFRTK